MFTEKESVIERMQNLSLSLCLCVGCDIEMSDSFPWRFFLFFSLLFSLLCFFTISNTFLGNMGTNYSFLAQESSFLTFLCLWVTNPYEIICNQEQGEKMWISSFKPQHCLLMAVHPVPIPVPLMMWYPIAPLLIIPLVKRSFFFPLNRCKV